MKEANSPKASGRRSPIVLYLAVFSACAGRAAVAAFLGGSPPRGGGRSDGASKSTASISGVGAIVSSPRGRSSSRLLAANADEASEEKGEKVGLGAAPRDAPKPAAPAAPSEGEKVGSGGSEADELSSRLMAEVREIGKCSSLLFGYVTKNDGDATAEDVVRLCDDLENVRADIEAGGEEASRRLLTTRVDLRSRTLRAARYETLNKLMRSNYDAYVATASFLSPGRIPRDELPNVQDVPYPDVPAEATPAVADLLESEEGQPLVADCALEKKSFDDSPLDKLLLKIFRNLVEKNTGGISSPEPGIEGLLEQGRTYMLRPGQTPEAQHRMVMDTLGGLMTPVLPPFYRIFMSGIVPKLGTDWDGKQIGPWFYAPWLTSVVTPTFFGFLVGPSRPNSRRDGRPGGLVVEKCKFLQESGCKGLCLHQCKLPAQQFFKEELGLDLTVSPNFVTQECQWSFGEVPLPPEEDPSFPRGCLVGCESRKAMAGAYADALGSGGKPAVGCL